MFLTEEFFVQFVDIDFAQYEQMSAKYLIAVNIRINSVFRLYNSAVLCYNIYIVNKKGKQK